jgi:hypothetical protein
MGSCNISSALKLCIEIPGYGMGNCLGYTYVAFDSANAFYAEVDASKSSLLTFGLTKEVNPTIGTQFGICLSECKVMSTL